LKTRFSFTNNLKSTFQSLVIFFVAASLIVLGIIFPKSETFGDAVQDNSAGTWQGTLGPKAPGTAGADIDLITATLTNSYNTNFSRYEVGLGTGETSGYIRSSQIAPFGGTLKKWKKLKFGFIRPTSGTSRVTVDILCGDPSQPDANCPTYDQPIPGFSNIALNASDEYDIPASLLATKIKLRVNFSRSVVSDETILLYDWQVFWEVNSGVSLVVSKTPNPANPQKALVFIYPDPNIPNNYLVTYTLSYSLDRNVGNLKIELPFPTGCYQPSVGSPREYTVTFHGSSGGGTTSPISGAASCNPKNKVVWNLGNKSSGTTGSVTASFRVNNGAVDGMTLKSKATISGSDYPELTLPEDQLNIQSKALMYSPFTAPEYIAPGRDVMYLINFNTGSSFQSDIFNARYEFSYSSCLLNNSNPSVYGSGASNVVFDNANRKVIFYLASPQTQSSGNFKYAVLIRSAASCALTNIPATLTIYSEQDADFVKQKVVEVKTPAGNYSIWDSTSTPQINVFKSANKSTVGAGQRLDYTISLDNRTNVGLGEFYLLEKIPNQTTFIGIDTQISFGGDGYKLGVPVGNNWKIYWSSYSGSGEPPRGNHPGGWTQCGQGPTFSCTVAAGQETNVKWIKWDVGTGQSFNWDRNVGISGNFNIYTNLSVVTDTSSVGSIDNLIKYYANNICQTGCQYTISTLVNNQPFLSSYYYTCRTLSGNFPSNCATGSFIDVNAGDYFWVYAWVYHSNGSNGDANDVRVTLKLPDRKYLDANPVDLTGTYALCNMNTGYTKNCPDASGTVINNAPWTDPSNNADPLLRPDVTCPAGGGAGSCTIVWQSVPVIYSLYKYPATRPTSYSFIVKVKSKPGVLNQTLICEGNCQVVNVTSSPPNANVFYPYTSVYDVRLLTNPELTITKTSDPPYSLAYGATKQFTITYKNNSNGATANAVVIDAIPNAINPADGSTPNITPLPRMIFSGYTNPQGEQVYFMTDRDRTGPAPLPNDPAWQPIANVTGKENIVDWVMWLYNNQFNPGESHSVTLTLRDSGSPHGTVFQNLAYVSFLNGSSYTTPSTFQFIPSLAPENLGSRVTIINPGFSSTINGNVGSVSGFGFLTKSANCVPPNPTDCTTTYLGISGAGTLIDSSFFSSAKNWLISDYGFEVQNNQLTTNTNFSSLYSDYGKKAVSCNSEIDCLSGSENVKIFTVSEGNPFRITPSTNSYSSVPRILFIDNSSGGDALEINNNFTIRESSALIFVVRGNVKVNYGVDSIDGVFLVEGKFYTGRRVQKVTNKEAGKFATISIGQDGFARIAYLSENNVRFIKCKDLDCDNRDYGYVTTASNVVSMAMDLHAAGPNLDYPKIIVSQIDENGKATTKFVNCYDKNLADGTLRGETCLDNDTKTYDNTKDSDITVVAGFPAFVLGLGNSAPRAANYAVCAPDPNCLNPTLSQIDGGGNGEDKGNEINISFDVTASPTRLVASYVDRSLGKSDLWMAKFSPTNTGTGCFGTTSWTCTLISSSPGNIGLFPSSDTPTNSGIQNGKTRFAYLDTSTNELKYYICGNVDCNSALNAPLIKTINCGANCTIQPYVSLKHSFQLAHILYNTTNTSSGTPKKEVKFSFCLIVFNCPSMITHNLTNNPVFTAQNAITYNQSLAYGIGTENQLPRVVFYNEDDKSLYYIRCKANLCDPSDINNLTYKKIDSGEAIALPDKPLTINGSVITTFGSDNNIYLERDLFLQATVQPAEIINFQPKYYYILREVIKEPEIIREEPP